VSQSNFKQFAVEIANQIKTQQLLDKSTSVVATCSTRGSRTAPVASTPSAGKQVLLWGGPKGITSRLRFFSSLVVAVSS